MKVPSVGRTVHYVSYGTPGGEYRSQDRAAVITEVFEDDRFSSGISDRVSLCVLNPQGLFFNERVEQDEDTKAGGTWHWPEYAPETQD